MPTRKCRRGAALRWLIVVGRTAAISKSFFIPARRMISMILGARAKACRRMPRQRKMQSGARSNYFANISAAVRNDTRCKRRNSTVRLAPRYLGGYSGVRRCERNWKGSAQILLIPRSAATHSQPGLKRPGSIAAASIHVAKLLGKRSQPKNRLVEVVWRLLRSGGSGKRRQACFYPRQKFSLAGIECSPCAPVGARSSLAAVMRRHFPSPHTLLCQASVASVWLMSH